MPCVLLCCAVVCYVLDSSTITQSAAAAASDNPESAANALTLYDYKQQQVRGRERWAACGCHCRESVLPLSTCGEGAGCCLFLPNQLTSVRWCDPACADSPRPVSHTHTRSLFGVSCRLALVRRVTLQLPSTRAPPLSTPAAHTASWRRSSRSCGTPTTSERRGVDEPDCVLCSEGIGLD